MSDVAVIMNTYNEEPGLLDRAIASYRDQTRPPTIIVSTVEGDPGCEAPADIVHVTPKAEHPGHGPDGIFVQWMGALWAHLGEFEWFTYASSNDVALPGKCEQEVEACAGGALVCYSDFYIVDGEHEHLHNSLPRYNYGLHLQRQYINDCAMVHRSAWERCGPTRPEYGLQQLWDFWLRLYETLGDVYTHNPRPTWRYYHRRNSLRGRRLEDPEAQRKNREAEQRMLADHRK